MFCENTEVHKTLETGFYNKCLHSSLVFKPQVRHFKQMEYDKIFLRVNEILFEKLLKNLSFQAVECQTVGSAIHV